MSDYEEPPAKLSKHEEEYEELDEGQEEWLSEEILTDEEYNQPTDFDNESVVNTSQDNTMGSIPEEALDQSLDKLDSTNEESSEHKSKSDNIEQALVGMQEEKNSDEDLPGDLGAFLIRKADGKILRVQKDDTDVDSVKHSDDGNDTDELLRMLGDDDQKVKNVKKELRKAPAEKHLEEHSSDDEEYYETSKLMRLKAAKKTITKKIATKALPEEMSDEDGDNDMSSDEASTVKKMFNVRTRSSNFASKSTAKPTRINSIKTVTKRMVTVNTPPGKTRQPILQKPKASPIKSPEPQKKSKPEPQIKTNLEPLIKSKPEPQIKSKLEPLIKTKPGVQIKLKPVAQMNTRPEPHIKSKPVLKTKSKPESQNKSKPEPQTKLKSESDIKPTLEKLIKTKPELTINVKETSLYSKPIRTNQEPVKESKLEDVNGEEEFLDDEQFEFDEELAGEATGDRSQPIMSPERMDEEIPSDPETASDEDSLYDELPSSDTEDFNDWFTLDIRAERAGDYIPLLGSKAQKVLLEEKNRVSGRVSNLRNSLSALAEGARAQADQLKRASLTIAELDAALKAV